VLINPECTCGRSTSGTVIKLNTIIILEELPEYEPEQRIHENLDCGFIFKAPDYVLSTNMEKYNK